MSFGELLFLILLALLVFGPRKLPEIARTVAKIMTDLRRASNEFRYTLEEEIRKIEVTEHPAQRLEVIPARVEGSVSRDEAESPTGEEPEISLEAGTEARATSAPVETAAAAVSAPAARSR